MESETKDVVQGVTKSDIIDKILAKAPELTTVTLDLPSRNKFYTLPDPGMPITMRPMTFDDEKFMITGSAGSGEMVNVLLERCVSNLHIAQIFMADKMYLLLKLREISYGEEFSSDLQCPGCDDISNITFNLSQLPIEYIKDDFEFPIEVNLSVIEQTAKVLLPRVQEEPYFKTPELILANLWRMVAEIAGRTEKDIISEVIDKLPLKDAHTLVAAITGETYFGVQTEVNFVCPSCKRQEVMDMPITSDFFTVS